MILKAHSFSDAQLISMIQGSSGDRDKGLKYIYRTWGREAADVLKREHAAVEDVNDCVDYGLIRLDASLRAGSFKGQSALKTYYIGICRIHYLSILRGRVRIDPDTDPVDVSPVDLETPMLYAEREEVVSFVRGVLEKLSLRCQELLHLYMLGFSGEEITQKMIGTPGPTDKKQENADRNALFECRARFRRLCQSNPEFASFIKEFFSHD